MGTDIKVELIMACYWSVDAFKREETEEDITTMHNNECFI